ncbi:4-alpha-glucanotransferase (amylomaltase) [Lachnospiraceae bacterium TWA4]|nr:4-alpha-glucanotransferase (amylomaltase) [Lachnospiraceae bacterium TWA4]
MKTTLERGAGLLLPIYSLPSPYGIGTLGKSAYDFINFLVKAGQKYWQVLPVGPTSYGDSPYQSFSSFAGNPYFIDLDMLCDEGLLNKQDLDQIYWGYTPEYVDYDVIYKERYPILKKAFLASNHKDTKDYLKFCDDNKFWLEDYALFMAVKGHNEGADWLKWPEDIRTRQVKALNHYRELLKEDIDFWMFLQFKFFEQWEKLREYAKEKGILLIGDMPIYAALDSADVWVYHKFFQLDKDLVPKAVAGVPPDAFSEDGQLWGNPLYDWMALEEDDFSWWRKRIACAAALYDAVRIDHFIGVVRYFAVPYGEETAKNGKFFWGPGKKLIKALKEEVGDTKIIAEDLGVMIDEVKELKDSEGLPGMKIIEFAFDGGNDNDHLPVNYEQNCIVYGGTHDNETLQGYFSRRQDWPKQYVMEYMGLNEEQYKDIVPYIFRLAYSSVASVAIFQVQDVLGLGNEARTNEPSTSGNNWKWRLTEGRLTEHHSGWLNRLTWLFNRQ